MAERRLFKEYKQCKKTPPSLSNPQIISLAPVDEENIFVWHSTIAKPDKAANEYYYGGQWDLSITVSPQYPMEPPVIKFITPIIHPNINATTGEICLDILKKESWSPAWNLQYLITAILMLLDSPEPASPLNIDAANLYRHDTVAFESLIQFSLWKYNSFYRGNNPATAAGSGNVDTATTTSTVKATKLSRDISGSKNLTMVN